MLERSFYREEPITRSLPPIFDGVNEVDAASALRRFTTHRVAAKERLLEEGRSAQGLICVVEGELEVRAGGTVVGTARPGDLVGEMALFEEGARTATVLARTDTRLMVLTRAGYEELRDTAHPVAHRIERDALELQVIRLRHVGDRIATLALGSPAELAPPDAGFLATLAALFGRGGLFTRSLPRPEDTLARSPLFADATDTAREAIAGSFTPESYAAGHLLCAEGERGDRMYLLDEGRVDVVISTARERLDRVASLEGGAAFGMVSLARNSPRMSTCVAATPVVVQVLDEAGWLNLINDPRLTGSAFRRAIIRTFAEQLRVSNAQLAAFDAERRPDHAPSPDSAPLLRASASMENYGATFEEGR